VRHVVLHIIKQATANSRHFLYNAYVSNYFGQTAAICVIQLTAYHTPNTPFQDEDTNMSLTWGVSGIYLGGKTWRWQSYHIHVPTAVKCGSLNVLEHSGSLQGLLYKAPSQLQLKRQEKKSTLTSFREILFIT